MQTCFALLTLGLLAGSAYARDATVDGLVYEERDGYAGRSADEPGVADVAVSNGEQIVRTDARGRYRLPVRDGQTVFVIKPGDRGFVPAADGLPAFWRHYAPSGSAKHNYSGIAATGRNTRHWDFALTPRASAAADGFQMLVFADTQTAKLADVGYYQRDIVAPLIGKTTARLGTTLGDLVSDDLGLYPALNKVTTQLGVPWFHVPGNHDLNFDAHDDAQSLDSWRAVYGPDTYAVEQANASFVFLDDVIYTPGGKPAYIGGLREDQFVFLQTYLAQLPRDRLLVLGMHIHLFDAVPGQETFRHADRRRLFALLKDVAHVLVLSGHSHTQRQVDYGADEGWQGARPLHEYNVGAACGAFWSGVKDADGIPDATMSDGTPNGYAVVQVAPSGEYTLAYHAARAPADAQVLLHAPKVLRRGAYAAWGIYANVFMGQNDTLVEMRIDHGAWQPMKRVERADPRVLAENVRDDAAAALRGDDRSPEATPSTHVWRGVLPTTLAAGEHTVDVRAHLPTGQYDASTVYRLQTAEP